MRTLSRKNRTSLLTIGASLLILGMTVGVQARITGITGQSSAGCLCHGATPSVSVTVTITGIPPNYTPGNTYSLTITVAGGPATTNGGFDLSVTGGVLSTADPNAQILLGEATHRNNLARSWSVSWQAPPMIVGVVTFFVAGNAVNGDGTSSGDSWNKAVYTSSPMVADQHPVISLTVPDGTQDWTGGTSHLISWTMSDDITPPTSLVVYLNFSSTAGSGPIAGPIVGATSQMWNVPVIDASDARVNATVIDAGGLKGYSEVLVPKIDSTAPTVISSSPTGASVAIDTPVSILFSESMDRTSVETSFSTTPSVSNWVFVWSTTSLPDDTLTGTHDPFAPGTLYTATLSTGAKDVSDTGNQLAAQHQWQFTTASFNTPPVIALSRPLGSVSYSVGSVQNIVWTASDAQDSAANLKVWVNYSLTGSAPFNQQIAGLQGVAGTSSPYAWTIPAVNSATVVLNATIVDTAGAKGYGLSPTFGIDSTPPIASTLVPADLATNVPTNTNVQVIWSEPMNATPTEAAFSLKDTATWTTVAGVISWAGSTMVFNPSASLAATTQYQANITATAMDASIPGNFLAGSVHWSFTTSGSADLTPPTISATTAIPSPQAAGQNVNVSAMVQDDNAVGTVWLKVTPPGSPGTSTNDSMSLDSASGRYFLNTTYATIGTYGFLIWASDSSGNWNSASGQFVMSDVTPPAAPIGLTVEQISGALKLTWTANTEPDLAGYKIYRSLQAGGPYTLLNTAALVTLTTYTDSGLEEGKTYYYVVTAVDDSGNESPRSNEASGLLAPHSQPPNADLLPIILIIIVIVVIVVILILLLIGRKRKARGPETGQPPGQQAT